MKDVLVSGLIIIMAALAAVIGYGLNSDWLGSAVAAGLGLLWLSGQRRATGWVSNPAFMALVGVAAWGVWAGVATGWMLTTTVAALAAWDLAHFRRRLAQVAQVENQAKLTQEHLQRLLLVAGLGWLVGGAAGLIRFELSLVWVAGLGLLLLIGLSRLLGPGRP